MHSVASKASLCMCCCRGLSVLRDVWNEALCLLLKAGPPLHGSSDHGGLHSFVFLSHWVSPPSPQFSLQAGTHSSQAPPGRVALPYPRPDRPAQFLPIPRPFPGRSQLSSFSPCCLARAATAPLCEGVPRLRGGLNEIWNPKARVMPEATLPAPRKFPLSTSESVTSCPPDTHGSVWVTHCFIDGRSLQCLAEPPGALSPEGALVVHRGGRPVNNQGPRPPRGAALHGMI